MTPGRKALIIDDSAMLLRYAVSVLATRMPGLEVHTASRGGEGFYQADKLRPDLLLIDHALPDTPGGALCRRLGQHPATATLPIILLCGQGVDPKTAGAGHPNVFSALTKPFTPEELLDAVHAALAAGPRPAPALPPDRSRARLQLPTPAAPPTARERRSDADDSRIIFCGTTASFSLKSALLAAVAARDQGVLRFTDPATTAAATEVYLRGGKVALVTTRDPDLYGAAPALPADTADAQRATGCPPFLTLLANGQLPENEALLATADHGQRLFAQLWAQPRLDFEFERLPALPDFVLRLPDQLPAPAPDLEALDEATRETLRLNDWLLGTLRRLRPEDLPALTHGHGRFDGVPAYTREGYAAIRRLRLTDLETAFARQVNGRSDLCALAGHLGLGTPAVFLLLFRFHSVGFMDLWPASTLTPPPAESGPPTEVFG